MQIDFHFGVTYVLARLAGFGQKDAYTVAHSSQYVDDATNAGLIKFTDGSMYYHISSANKTVDKDNYNQYADHLAWLPFHFLPGNGGLPAGEGNDLSFVDRALCKPNSFIAQDMVAESICRKNTKHGLHRFGITMHVYADTWAHQDFAGIINDINLVKELDTPHQKLISNIEERLVHLHNELKGNLGHSGALEFPDYPYLKWSYVNGRNKPVKRDNPKDYAGAIDNMYAAMRRYLLGDPAALTESIPAAEREKIIDLLTNTKDPDGEKRLDVWISAIGNGTFSVNGETISDKVEYISKGKGSWKHAALGTEAEEDEPSWEYDFDHSFLTSDWRLFHDALLTHRFYVLTDLLPSYGISAA